MAVVAGRGVASGASSGRATNGDVTSGTNGSDVSQREDLANFISMITRDETPFISSIGKSKSTSIYHEWQTDALNSPGDSKVREGTDYIVPGGITTSGVGIGTVNSQSVGDEFAVTGPDRSRLGNYTQINGKTIAVSGTRRAIDQAGVADEYAYQLKKRGTELRRDLEHDLIHKGQVSSASDTRSMGGFASFINDSAGVFPGASATGTVVANGAAFSGSKPGNALGTAVDVVAANVGNGINTLKPVDSTSVALSLSDIDSVMQRIYQEGGKASKIMLSPKLRRDFSDLMVTDSGVRRNIDMDGKLRQSVDIYMSDFGDLMVVPNYIMGLNYDVVTGLANEAGSNNAKDWMAMVYDPMWFNLVTLRPLQEVDVGQRGDSTVGMMVEECSFEVRNPIGCGAIYNLA